MKSSATLTVMTLVATGALGVAMMQGCTVTSTDPDTSSTSSSGSSGTSSGSSGNNNEQDAAPEAAAPTCELNGKQAVPLTPASCQTCMEGACCTQMKTCFDLVVANPETELDCNKLFECVLDCGEDNECATDCAELAPDAVIEAFNGIQTCGKSSTCNADAACNFQ